MTIAHHKVAINLKDTVYACIYIYIYVYFKNAPLIEEKSSWKSL